MSAPESVLDAQVNALQKLVESTQEARCRELREDAQRRVKETVRRAHKENRARMRAAINEQRERMEDTLAATRARLATRARQRRQSADKERLELAWSRLHEVLLERWRDARCRQRWALGLVEEALVHLPGERWRIEHPKDMNPAELSSMNQRITDHCGGEPPELVGSENLPAGLRIIADGACLDGTVEGLLTDRSRVEAELLALLRDQHHDESKQ